MNDRKVCPMVAGRAILSAYCSAITQQLYHVYTSNCKSKWILYHRGSLAADSEREETLSLLIQMDLSARAMRKCNRPKAKISEEMWPHFSAKDLIAYVCTIAVKSIIIE